MAAAHGHAQLVQLALHFHHIGKHPLGNDAKILVAKFLPLGRTRAKKGATGYLYVGPGKIEVVINGEIFLLKPGIRHHRQFRFLPEQAQHALGLAIERLAGAQQRRFFVQSHARPRKEHGGDAQKGAVGVSII